MCREGTEAVQEAFGAYRRVQTETAPPAQLILMLYDGLLTRLNSALNGLETNDYEEVNGSLQRAQEIVLELAASLDMERGEIADNLMALYEYQHHLLVEANVAKDPAPVRQVATMAGQLREAWVHALEQIATHDAVAEEPDARG
jgi:flagellar protein FliS